MAAPTIKGRDNILKHFKTSKIAYWKLYNAFDMKSPLMTCNSTKNCTESESMFVEYLDVLDPNGCFVLDSFTPGDTKEKSMIRPDSSICFSLKDASHQYQNSPKQVSEHENKTMSYSPEFGEHIKLITDNAKLKAEYEFATIKLTEALGNVSRLEAEKRVLEDFIESEEEEEEEEEEESATMGSAKEELHSALAGLIKDKGGLIIENLFGGANKKPDINPVMNGTNDENQMYISICESLKVHDPEILKHLTKLLAIAQYQPETFKMIITQLEAME